MHISLRYGKRIIIAIKHLQNSIKNKVVSCKGSGWGTLRKICDEHMLAYPDQQVTIDLRAGDNEIIAVGYLKGSYHRTDKSEWIGWGEFKYTFDVEWKCVYYRPITIQQFCEIHGINPDLLLPTNFHANHCWRSPDLSFTIKPENFTKTDEYVEYHFDVAEATAEDMLQHQKRWLLGGMENEHGEKAVKLLTELLEIYRLYPSCITFDDKIQLEPTNKPTKKLKAKKPTKKQKSENKRKNWASRTKKRIIDMGDTSNYAIAKHFTEKRYKTERGKRKWSYNTIKGLKARFGIKK